MQILDYTQEVVCKEGQRSSRRIGKAGKEVGGEIGETASRNTFLTFLVTSLMSLLAKPLPLALECVPTYTKYQLPGSLSLSTSSLVVCSSGMNSLKNRTFPSLESCHARLAQCRQRPDRSIIDQPSIVAPGGIHSATASKDPSLPFLEGSPMAWARPHLICA